MKLGRQGGVLAATAFVLGSAPPSLHAQVDSLAYAGTPEVLLPYRAFQLPYKKFFTEPQGFFGPGRDTRSPRGLQEVRIGFLGPLEGSRAARIGRRMLQAAELAVEEANARGGFRGVPFALVTRNDLGLWGASSNELVQLYDAGVWATVGSVDGANTHIMLRLALKMDMPLVNTASTDPTLTETAIPWMIRCISDDRRNSYALALHLRETLGLDRVALLRANDRYGRVGTGEFRDAMKRLGAPILVELRYAPGDTVFAAQLARIRRASAQAVVVWGDAEDAGRIVKAMRDEGMTQTVAGPDPLVSSEFLTVAGAAAEGVIATSPYDPESTDSAFAAFHRRFLTQYGEPPDAFAAHTYDGMNILIEAIGRAGLNRVRIRDELTSLTSFRGVTGEIRFDATWNDIGPIWLAEVRQGVYHFFPSPLE